MAIRFEKNSDNEAKNEKPAKNVRSQDEKLDSDTYASLQKPEKQVKKKRF